MASTPRGGSGMYSNPPVGTKANLGSTGPLDALKGKMMVVTTGPPPSNDFNKIKSPPVVRRK